MKGKYTYERWKKAVNMNSRELKKFMDSPEGKVAGLSKGEASKLGIKSGRASARAILRMKKRKPQDWSRNDWEWANRQISFVARMSGNPGPLYDEIGRKTRKHTSLLIWGHNPKKK